MKDNDELKKQREELEVRLSALKSQYEGRLSRQERELRDLRGQQERQEQRDEQPEAGPSKVSLVAPQAKMASYGVGWWVPVLTLCLVSDAGAAEER